MFTAYGLGFRVPQNGGRVEVYLGFCGVDFEKPASKDYARICTIVWGAGV